MNKIYATATVFLMCFVLFGATKKSLRAVNIDQLIGESQPVPSNLGADEIAFVWWISQEFWEVSMAQDDSMSYTEKQEFLNMLGDISIMCVFQGELSDYGISLPYSKEKVQSGMTILYTNENGNTKLIKPMSALSPDLDFMLNTIMQGMMANSLGQMGENMHMYVIDNRGTTKIDPYKKGILTVNLTGDKGKQLSTDLQFPLNSLYVPRVCPNGKEAHISWDYCPWTGKHLGK